MFYGIHFFVPLQWAVLPLIDNFAEDRYRYAVFVYTGWETNAETESNISFIITGTESDTGVRKLNDGKRKVSYYQSILIRKEVYIVSKLSLGTFPGKPDPSRATLWNTSKE